MSGPKLPGIPPMRPGEPPGPGMVPTEEQLAYAMQNARAQMVVAAMQAGREQMAFELKQTLAPMNLDSVENRVLQAGMAVTAVTAAQILTDNVIDAFAKRLEVANGRIAALEATIGKLEAAVAGHEKAAEHVAELAKRLEQAIASFTGAPPLDEREREFLKVGLAALGEGADDASEDARRAADLESRLKEGQSVRFKVPRLGITCDHMGGAEYHCAICAPDVKAMLDQAAAQVTLRKLVPADDGVSFREETDDEMRERLKRQIAETKP